MKLFGKNKCRKKLMIIIILLILMIIWIIPTVFIRILKENISTINSSYNEKNIYGIHNIVDLYKTFTNEIIYEIDITNDTIFVDNFDINITIKNYNSKNEYKIQIYVDDKMEIDENLKKEKQKFHILLENEGNKNIKVVIYQSGEKKVEENRTIFFIEPYEKQFLEEFSSVGIGTHYLPGYDDIKNSIELLKALGVKNVRNSMKWSLIEKDGMYNFNKIDYWFSELKETNINVLAILLDDTNRRLGDDYQISNNKELNEFAQYVHNISEKYKNQLIGLEIWNEPNIKGNSNESKKWYAKMIEKSNEHSDEKIISGATGTPYQTNESEQFIKDISVLGAYKNSDSFSYHIYSFSYDMKWLKDKNISHKKLVNDLGGFQNLYITEYGISTIKVADENERNEKLIKQTITSINQGINATYLYNLIDDSETVQYGIIDKNNKPKPAYYAMKNFLKNTNGAEYIGNLDLAEKLEAHVYDKDGKPVIIAWSNNSSKNIEINYKNFTAKDIYGKEIKQMKMEN